MLTKPEINAKTQLNKLYYLIINSTILRCLIRMNEFILNDFRVNPILPLILRVLPLVHLVVIGTWGGLEFIQIINKTKCCAIAYDSPHSPHSHHTKHLCMGGGGPRPR